MAEQCAPTVTYPDTFIQHIPAHSYSATSPRTTALLFLWVVLSPPPLSKAGDVEMKKGRS